MTQKNRVTSIIMAAGRGSRMKNHLGNKTLLPLIPGPTEFQGQRPFIHNILENLPKGPKCIVVHHGKDQVIEATLHFNVSYCEQKTLDGTGGALLACRSFLQQIDCDPIIITMGDVPLVKRQTYSNLFTKLKTYNMVVLGFCPEKKRQYGLLDTSEGFVKRVVEWKYWKDMPKHFQEKLDICNSGIYAVRRNDLLQHLDDLALTPHKVEKVIHGETRVIREYFITDLVEIFSQNGKTVGYEVVEDPNEVMGVDDTEALIRAQELYKSGKYGKT